MSWLAPRLENKQYRRELIANYQLRGNYGNRYESRGALGYKRYPITLQLLIKNV